MKKKYITICLIGLLLVTTFGCINDPVIKTPAPTSTQPTTTPKPTTLPPTTAPPKFTILGIAAPSSIAVGNNLEIKVTVRNRGGTGHSQVCVEINDGVTSKTVWIPEGEDKIVTFLFRPTSTGTITIRAGGYRDYVTVTELPITTMSPPTLLQIGEEIKFERVDKYHDEHFYISITKCEQCEQYRSDYGRDFVPSPGMKYLFCYITIKNIGATKESMTCEVTVVYENVVYGRIFFHEEKYGAEYQATDDFIYTSTIEPNEINEGWAPIEIPANINFKDAKIVVYDTYTTTFNDTVEELEDNFIASWEFPTTVTMRETPPSRDYDDLPGFGPYVIKYVVEGTAKYVDVCYENEYEGTSMYDNIKVPWSYSFKAGRGQFLYMSAQNCGESGTVIVSIYIDGHFYKKSTSSGAYVIATASGSVYD